MNNIVKNARIASNATLKYGLGTVVLETNGEIAAIEIDYIGAIKGIKKLGQGWTIRIGENKIIIFTLAKSNYSEQLFNYVGELKINSCKFVNWNQELFHAQVEDLNQNTWNQNYGTFDFDARKPEEIETQKIIGRKVKKSSI